MTRVQVEFTSGVSAVRFVSHLIHATDADAWERLASIEYWQDEASSRVLLVLPHDMVRSQTAQAALNVTLGYLLEKPVLVSGRLYSMQEFYKRIPLAYSKRTERASRCLVIPDTGDGPARAALIIALADQSQWVVWAHVFLDSSGGEFEVFELQSIDAQPHPAPVGLPGAPLIFTAVADDIFVPPGRLLPLIPHHRQFLPRSEPGHWNLWLGNPDGSHDHDVIHTSGNTPGEPLVNFVRLDDIRTPPRRLRGIDVRQKIPLELRRVYRRRLQRAAKVIYRIETRTSELGTTLLRLLDHTEAGIEAFTYFCAPRGDGPNAIVEHFLMADALIADEDQWPDLHRYDCPQTFAELDLPVFVSADLEFLPNIENLPAIAQDDSDFLIKFREIVGLNGEKDPRIALLDREQEGQGWNVLLLENGVDLKNVIDLVF